jgi:DNA-3-methyladenine glycosylase I
MTAPKVAKPKAAKKATPRTKAPAPPAASPAPAATPAVARCAWAGTQDFYIDYHDREWGVPLHDDRMLFEFLILEGAQAGLSWSTILKKRPAYRAAYDDFDPAVVARYDTRRKAKLMANEGIVRNRLKIDASVQNARAFLEIQQEFGSFDAYIWQFVGGAPMQTHRTAGVPASTAESDAMSKALKKRGFTFVGTTICYAFMQATGMVNDHVTSCFRYKALAAPASTSAGSPRATPRRSGAEPRKSIIT